MVIVNDLSGEKPERKFTFDHALWSHDRFVNDDKGYSRGTDGKYCDQDKVMKLLGNTVLEKAWKGLNSTLFAYGQTGAGKSYSIFGYGENKGIIPNASIELFERIKADTQGDTSFRVSVQMVEIYMEKI